MALRKSTEFTKGRYRGILSEIADEEKVSVACVRQSIFLHKNPRMISKANAKKAQRDKVAKQSLQEAQ
jgi:hypothetical protein